MGCHTRPADNQWPSVPRRDRAIRQREGLHAQPRLAGAGGRRGASADRRILHERSGTQIARFGATSGDHLGDQIAAHIGGLVRVLSGPSLSPTVISVDRRCPDAESGSPWSGLPGFADRACLLLANGFPARLSLACGTAPVAGGRCSGRVLRQIRCGVRVGVDGAERGWDGPPLVGTVDDWGTEAVFEDAGQAKQDGGSRGALHPRGTRWQQRRVLAMFAEPPPRPGLVANRTLGEGVGIVQAASSSVVIPKTRAKPPGPDCQ
jgi:hypothetical protein